jgi:hypothetical protein
MYQSKCGKNMQSVLKQVDLVRPEIKMMMMVVVMIVRGIKRNQ